VEGFLLYTLLPDWIVSGKLFTKLDLSSHVCYGFTRTRELKLDMYAWRQNWTKPLTSALKAVSTYTAADMSERGTRRPSWLERISPVVGTGFLNQNI
jgi:hypothetical protein